jgi:hypothetical protein
MHHWRIVFGASLAVTLAIACGSSSSNNNSNSGNGEDAGTSPDTGTGITIPPVTATCGVLTAFGGGTTADASTACPTGQTCCTMLSLTAETASCVAPGNCAGGISNECTTGSDCTGGQVCCAGAATTDGGAEGGGGGGIFNIDLSAFDTTCQPSCQPGQAQECMLDSECTGGQTCQSVFGGGMNIPGFADGGLGAAKTCRAPVPDAGSTPVPDSGTSPPTPDAGGDAQSDAPSSD